MSNICDTAKYILKKCGDMSSIRLQKLCYYAQAVALGTGAKPLFEEDFETWESGPMSRHLHDVIGEKMCVKASDVTGTDGYLGKKAKLLIDEALGMYAGMGTAYLIALSKCDPPYKKAWQAFLKQEGSSPGTVRKEDMRVYYKRTVSFVRAKIE